MAHPDRTGRRVMGHVRNRSGPNSEREWSQPCTCVWRSRRRVYCIFDTCFDASYVMTREMMASLPAPQLEE
eukprot:2572243-Pyramimonas_sp.AAC.1